MVYRELSGSVATMATSTLIEYQIDGEYETAVSILMPSEHLGW